MTTAPPGVPGLQTPTGPTGRPGHYNYTSGRPGLHTKSPQDGSPGVAPPAFITTAPPAVGPTGEPGVHVLTPTPYFNTTGVCLCVWHSRCWCITIVKLSKYCDPFSKGFWDTSTPTDDGLPRVVCVEGQFACRTFGCVEAALVCDGREDCPDGSDEDRCGKNKTFILLITCHQCWGSSVETANHNRCSITVKLPFWKVLANYLEVI